jgi:hypothetical protein
MPTTEKSAVSTALAATGKTPTTVAKASAAKLPAKSATKRATPARKAAPVAAQPTTSPVAKSTKTAKASKTVATPATNKAIPSKVAKVKKPKMVRDSFTIPKPEYDVLNELKLRAAKLGSPAKKTELVRAGIKLLAALSDTAYRQALRAVPSLKTGRPAKAKQA